MNAAATAGESEKNDDVAQTAQSLQDWYTL